MENEIYTGDCLNVLDRLDENQVDLVYLDPPFFSQKQHKLRTRDNRKEYVFNDKWLDIHEYSAYMKERIQKCRKVLKDSGSIFLHCDRSASHYLRIMLDEVFGEKNFQSEIVWCYKRWSNAKKGLLNSHQIIYFYSKTANFKFNHQYEDYSLTTNLDQIFQKRERDHRGKSVYKKDGGGGYEILETKNGVPLSDIWEIPYLNPKAKERIGYPTQKPILLLERIIELVTDVNDLVLDLFCGSGTTLVAAKLLNRKFIGIDISEEAVTIAKERVMNPVKSNSQLLINGKDSYKNQSNEVLSILKKIDAAPVQRNKGIDGFLKYANTIKPIPIRIQRNEETLEEAKSSLKLACQKNQYEKKVVLKTNNNTGNFLFDCNETDDGIFIFETIEDLERFRFEWIESQNQIAML